MYLSGIKHRCFSKTPHIVKALVTVVKETTTNTINCTGL